LQRDVTANDRLAKRHSIDESNDAAYHKPHFVAVWLAYNKPDNISKSNRKPYDRANGFAIYFTYSEQT